MVKNKFLKVLSFFIFPATVFFLNLFLGIFYNIYNAYPSLDIPMHFLGGISVGYMFVLFLKFFKEENMISVKSKVVSVIIVVCVVSFMAVLWEFYEFICVYYFGFNWPVNYTDTIGDLFFGICGGFVSAIIFRKV